MKTWDAADPDQTLPDVHERDDQDAPPSPGRAGRFEDLGLLGRGGMGEVRLVHDPMLQRNMALKQLLPPLRHDARAVSRFVEEARLTAQLQHPGVIPVHELWRLPDGSPYFTMVEVRGRTLREVIRGVHLAADRGDWAPAPDGWTLRRVIEALRRVAETVAYAHARGIIHCDLKPDNVMVGDFGEVLVLDWGLARPAASAPGERTAPASLGGTPGYMAPEVAGGRARGAGPGIDVYALGATLNVALVGRAPPHPGADPGPRGPSGAPLPEELRQAVIRATDPTPEARYPDAAAFAGALSDWLEGVSRRERALRHVAEADQAAEEARHELAQVERIRAAARARAEALQPWDPVDQKAEGWALEDEAARRELRAALAELRQTERLAAALTEVPDLPEAHSRLADHYQALAADAEGRRDHLAAARYEALLARHDRGAHAAWREGLGRFTLLTEPPGAQATLYRYVPERRRLVPVFERALGPTPLFDVRLPHGSYLVEVSAPGYQTLRYPVALDRLERWTGVRPTGSAPFRVPLAPEGALGPDEVYVPAGWTRSGDTEPTAGGLPLRRIWVDGFVIRRFPVTNAEVLELANALVAEGRAADAQTFVPWDKSARAPAYATDPDGRFRLRSDSDGDLWQLDWPAFLMDWHRARAFAALYAERTGQDWRLPWELEWEKAARGVDGRLFPWGDFADPTWANLRQSQPGDRPLPAPVGAYPTDQSPYGVRGLAGGVVDWCLDAFQPTGPELSEHLFSVTQNRVTTDDAPRTVRGGAFSFFEGGAVLGRRVGVAPSLLDYNVGLRLARSWPPHP